jgi:hypothetical protein
MLALFTIGTISLVKHVLYVEDSMEQYNEGYRKPNSLVLKKMEKAKKRWWRKNGEGSNVEVYRQGQQQVEADIQDSNVQQQANTAGQQQQTTGQQVFDSVGQVISNVTNQISEKAHFVQVPVIVETGEDGSMLIKLPPPKMGQEQPVIAEKLQIAAASIDQTAPVQESALTMKQADDDTVYIKLPYPEQSQRRALSDQNREEVDPPLRGASIPTHDHPNLKRRPPKPLELHSTTNKHDNKQHTTHGHFSVHAQEKHHPGVLDTLREEFGSWMKKHGKMYGTAEEKERRFHVWTRNHFRSVSFFSRTNCC